MVPPVDPLVLSSNPKFNALYSDLCNNRLNADGTSKLDAKAQRDHDTVKQELHQARVEATKKDLVKSGLQELSYRPNALPEELQQLVAIVAALLDGQIAEDDRYLLRDDLREFQDHIKQINSALAKALHEDASKLNGMLEDDEGPGNLTVSINTMKSSISSSQLKLHESRLSLAQEASKLHDLHRQVIERSMRILEQTIHGSVARGAKAKADYLALVAEGMDKKVNLQRSQLLAQVNSPVFQEVLETRLAELQESTRSAKRKARDTEERLEEYKKVQGMSKLAQEYADLLKEAEKVQSDIARLERAER